MNPQNGSSLLQDTLFLAQPQKRTFIKSDKNQALEMAGAHEHFIDTHTIETLPSPRVLEKVVCSRCSATSDVLGHLLACVAWRFWLGAQSK